VSVEAISWALNLAPVPRDRGGKRNPACKAVLVGLAKHAAPDGKEAFPSVRTLVRYNDLSERTVRTALDRLAAEGIIRPVPRRSLPRRSNGPISARRAGTSLCTSSGTIWTPRTWRPSSASSRA